ncbi:hypothetical protein OnM2_092037 [Erysiphe neolycopersici]|uniref:Uncharacterized protein n=1 Tax=Erysiphe neolycopersici TaxID=212602 RepID=A0A420HCB5_9PEZI|nr:hypothetical protein OnM2_092037 [Erysiphe neolycopersici]
MLLLHSSLNVFFCFFVFCRILHKKKYMYRRLENSSTSSSGCLLPMINHSSCIFELEILFHPSSPVAHILPALEANAVRRLTTITDTNLSHKQP